MGILQLLASRNYIALNKDLIKLLGLEEAIIFGELASEHSYWVEREQIEDGYFYSTIENIEEHTTLSAHKQRKALKNLQNMNLIDVKVKGIPAKRYIKINEEQVIEFFNDQLLKNLTTRNKKNKELDKKDFNGNNNITNKNITNKNIKKNISDKVADVPSKEENILKNEFEELWLMYPKKRGKKEAYESYCKYRKSLNSDYITKEDVEKGIINYNNYIKENHIQDRFIKYGSKFFEERAWEDDYQLPIKAEIPNDILNYDWLNDFSHSELA